LQMGLICTSLLEVVGGLMKKLTVVLFVLGFCFQSNAVDISCACVDSMDSENTCKDVKINLETTPDMPGTYLTVEFAEGAQTLEGYAVVRRDIRFNRTVYQISGFTLIKEGDLFSLLDKSRQCLAK